MTASTFYDVLATVRYTTLRGTTLGTLGQLGQFLGTGGEAFVERGLNLRRERRVLDLGDRDVPVAASVACVSM
ncbi:hypothetical protein [Leucobacter tenebrionis]|uniref:hypothetical protein n=1 Tax=Leucobacter tenebrionis TaxID=2873270 RepID=UPI001CA62C42|nr:hypothetical protein [Leucobacter tenebrionis]QZY50846.1 hypothetical protein KVY00_09380 [Leucobacter tenebrionis]